MQKKLSSLWAVALFLFIAILLPCYVSKAGYSYIGTDKYHFFVYGMLPFVITYILLLIYVFYKKIHISFCKTDWFVLAFAFCTLLSYLFSPYKDVALIGNEEWNLGLISQLMFVLIYFGISRYLTHIKGCLYAVCMVNIPLTALAIINRFGYYPIKIKGIHPLYVSTFGNINWFCGYLMIIVGMELYLYFQSKEKKEKCFFTLCLFLSLLSLICQGSMSGYATLLFLLLLLLRPALTSRHALLTYLEIYMLLFSGCTLTYISNYFIKGAYVEYDPIVNLVAFSPLPCVCLFLVASLYIIISFCTEKINLGFIYKYVVIVCIIFLAVYFIVCGINTFYPKITPFLNGNSFFTYNRYYFSTRGGTYTVGIQAFFSLPWYRKIMGIGPDCFLTYVYSHLDKISMAGCFQIQPLANAHNEFLTMLVNTGLLGCMAYMGIFFCSIKTALKTKNPYAKVVLYGILGYMINNFFSFQQIISTPFVFVLLGIIENFSRKEKINVTN